MNHYKLALGGLIGKQLPPCAEEGSKTNSRQSERGKIEPVHRVPTETTMWRLRCEKTLHFGSVLRRRAAVGRNTYFLSNMTDGAQQSGGTCNPGADKGDDTARQCRPRLSPFSLFPFPHSRFQSEDLVAWKWEILPPRPSLCPCST